MSPDGTMSLEYQCVNTIIVWWHSWSWSILNTVLRVSWKTETERVKQGWVFTNHCSEMVLVNSAGFGSTGLILLGLIFCCLRYFWSSLNVTTAVSLRLYGFLIKITQINHQKQRSRRTHFFGPCFEEGWWETKWKVVLYNAPLIQFCL